MGWPAALNADSTADALKNNKVYFTDDTDAVIASPDVEIVVDATGQAAAGIEHVLACCEHGKHIIMVNVEADALAGPLLARAREAGIVYSLAYGDQPALICEMVDWARACGFEVMAAGKGTKYLPEFHTSTPDTVWPYYGFTAEMVAAGDFNAQMFNSFLDGTKSAIEWPPCPTPPACSPRRPACTSRPAAWTTWRACCGHARRRHPAPSRAGGSGVLAGARRPAGVPRPALGRVRDAGGRQRLRAPLLQGIRTGHRPGGNYTAMYKPHHLLGLELGVSVASVGLRREPTGAPAGWHGDVVATAKRDLPAGQALDGEGGYTVYGRLMPARDSVEEGYLPLGLSHQVKLKHAVRQSQPIRWRDVEYDEQSTALRFRREMEQIFA